MFFKHYHQEKVSRLDVIYPRTVVSVSYHYRNPTKCVSLNLKRTSSSFHWNASCSRHDI